MKQPECPTCGISVGFVRLDLPESGGSAIINVECGHDVTDQLRIEWAGEWINA